MTTSCIQTNSNLFEVVFGLSAWIDRKITQLLGYADRVKNLILTEMYTARILGLARASATIIATFLLIDNSNDNVVGTNTTAALNITHTTNDADVRAEIISKINDFATTNSITITNIFGDVVGGMITPGAHIAAAPDDAVTNYNAVTTLLGSLTGAVNAANTKQNDIAATVNTLLSELQALGLIAS